MVATTVGSIFWNTPMTVWLVFMVTLAVLSFSPNTGPTHSTKFQPGCSTASRVTSIPLTYSDSPRGLGFRTKLPASLGKEDTSILTIAGVGLSATWEMTGLGTIVGVMVGAWTVMGGSAEGDLRQAILTSRSRDTVIRIVLDENIQANNT